MNTKGVAIAALGGVLLVVLLIFGIARPAPPVVEMTAGEIQARDAIAQATSTAVAVNQVQNTDRDRIIQPVLTGLQVLGLLAIGVVVLAIGGVALAAWHRRRPLVTVLDVPYSRAAVERGEYHPLIVEVVRGRSIAAIEAARRGGTPSSVHFAPHDSRKYEALPAPVGDDASVAQAVPSFTQLLDNGTVAPGRQLLRGYGEDGAAIMGGVGDLLSLICAGASGSGKTNTTAVLLAQAYLQNAAFIVADPHSEAEEDSLAGLIEPLAGSFVLPVATDDREILAALQFANDVMIARLTPSKATATQRARAAQVEGRSVLVVVDEANKVLARSTIGAAAAEILESIFAEGRKVKVFAALLGQTWLAARTGESSALRDLAASKYVHRTVRAQARLLLPTDLAPQCERLATGAAVMASRDGSFQTITMPLITPADIVRVAQMMSGDHPTTAYPASSNPPSKLPSTGASYRVIDAQPEGGAEDAAEGGPEGVTQAQIAELTALMMEGAKQAEKLATVFGCTESGGGNYQRACVKLRAAEAYIARRAGLARKARRS